MMVNDSGLGKSNPRKWWDQESQPTRVPNVAAAEVLHLGRVLCQDLEVPRLADTSRGHGESGIMISSKLCDDENMGDDPINW